MGEYDKTSTTGTDSNTWKRSRWSSLGWGIHCKSILPCDPDRCRYIDRRQCEEPPGDNRPCSFETRLFFYYLHGYDRQFQRARDVLGDDDYLALLNELAFLEVRLLRIKVRQNWLDLHWHEVKDDHDFVTKEVDRTFKYGTTARNRWAVIINALTQASLPPMHGLIDMFRVEWLKGWTEYGVGPACDIETREVSFERVWPNYRLNQFMKRVEIAAHIRPVEEDDDDLVIDPFVQFFESLKKPAPG